jgi:hypothetical protein
MSPQDFWTGLLLGAALTIPVAIAWYQNHEKLSDFFRSLRDFLTKQSLNTPEKSSNPRI